MKIDYTKLNTNIARYRAGETFDRQEGFTVTLMWLMLQTALGLNVRHRGIKQLVYVGFNNQHIRYTLIPDFIKLLDAADIPYKYIVMRDIRQVLLGDVRIFFDSPDEFEKKRLGWNYHSVYYDQY